MNDLLRTFVNLSSQEYDIFLHMSRRRRALGALGLGCIYSVLVVLVYLTYLPSMQENPATRPFGYGVMAILGTGLLLGLLPVVVPRLLDYRVPLMIGLLALGGFTGFLGAVLAEHYEAAAPSVHAPAALALVAGCILLTLGLGLYGRVMKTVASEKTRLESEIQLAQSIQARLLPAVEQETPRYLLHARSRLATEVGGDFFDVVDAGPNQLLVAVGDVSGHDVGAGLMMATTKGAFRASADAGLQPASIAQALNRIVFDHGGRRLFVSFQCALLDFNCEVLQLVNAGHMPLLHYRHASSKVHQIHTPAPALGLMRNPAFETLKIPFAPGDAFLFYTDGLTEVFDAARAEFGIDGVTQVFSREAGGDNPVTVVTALERAAHKFADGQRPHDDLTTVAVQVR